tara:strand:- start:219 stop:491 length:273 start_codon:yes stop_codon:yes gene_type:complete
MESNQKPLEKKKKKKTPRCACILEDGKKCRKKLTSVDLCIVCKCGKSFCALHRSAEKHNCKTTEELAIKSKQDQLSKVLGGGSFKQIEVI